MTKPPESWSQFVDFSKKLTKRMARAKSVRLKVGDVTETYLDGGADALYVLIGEENK